MMHRPPTPLALSRPYRSGVPRAPLCPFVESLHRLHEAEAGIFDRGLLLALLFLELLVLLLQLLHFCIEVLAGLLRLCLVKVNFRLQSFRRHLHELFNLFPLLAFTQIDVLGAANGSQIIRRKLLKILEAAASFVVFESTGITPLDGGKALHTMLFAQRLPCGSAVYISDKGCCRTLVLLYQLIPSRLHRLAMSSPWRKE